MYLMKNSFVWVRKLSSCDYGMTMENLYTNTCVLEPLKLKLN